MIVEESGSMKKKKSIPIKNYFILLMIIVGTFFIVYYFYRWYDVYLEYQNDIPIIRDTLPEVGEEEMYHYIQENPKTVVYLCTSDDVTCRNFEKNFKKLVERDSLKEYITYVNLTHINKEEFLNKFNGQYPYKKEIKSYPALIVFDSGNIVDVIQEKENSEITISDVKQLLKRNEVGSSY